MSKVSPTYRTPVAAIWTASILSVLFVWGSTLVSVAGTTAYTIVVSCTVIFLFLSFTVPIVLGMLALGTPKWDKMGPWNMGKGIFMLFAVLSILSVILIFVIGIQPPNNWALYITVGFFILTAMSGLPSSEPPLPGAAASATYRGAAGGDQGGGTGGRRNRPTDSTITAMAGVLPATVSFTRFNRQALECQRNGRKFFVRSVEESGLQR